MERHLLPAAGNPAWGDDEAADKQRRCSEQAIDLAEAASQTLVTALTILVSHDLNQPLSAAANFLATARILMSQEADREKILDVIRLGEEQILRAGIILRDLREPDYAEQGPSEAVCITEILRTSFATLLLASEPFGITLSCDVNPAAPIVWVDSAQAQTVVLNLVWNAIAMLRRTSGTGARRILITSGPAGGGMVEFSITPAGGGISQGDGHASSTAQRVVPEMRLSVSRKIVEMLGGSLTSTLQGDGYASVRFTLPEGHFRPGGGDQATAQNGDD